MTMNTEKQVQLKDKYCLTIEEASEYFGVGEKKLRQIVPGYIDAEFVFQKGVRYLIKRKRFEDFLEGMTAI